MQRTKKHSSIPREYPLPRLYTSVSTKEESLKVEADWHDYYELIYFQEGSFQLYLNLKEINIEEECLYLIPKGCVHRLYATSEKAVEHSLCFRLEDFCFSEEDILEQGFFRALREEEYFFPKEISLSHLGFLEMVQGFSEIYKLFHQHGKKESSVSSSNSYRLERLADHMMVKGRLLQLFAIMEGMGMISERRLVEEEKQVLFIKNSIEYIREHYAEKIYIRDLANLCRLNEQYFTRFFGNNVGISPLEYINRYRVEKAVEILSGGEDKVLDVAKATGFHNQGNFIKIFKSIMGETPHQYRKRLE